MQLYNSLSRGKEEFVPVQEGRAGVYVCGPTVYGHAHLGHAKSYVSFDVLVRYLRYLGYTTTYVQRDVRQVINVGDLQIFTGFLNLCAGRTAQEVNLSALGNDAGVSQNTARAWLSVLETSYLIHRLPAWHTNIRKQVVKAPKLHFFDSGLVCYLLGIREPEQLRLHPLRGAIFESWVVSEIYKSFVHSGLQPSLFHYREARGPGAPRGPKPVPRHRASFLQDKLPVTAGE